MRTVTVFYGFLKYLHHPFRFDRIYYKVIYLLSPLIQTSPLFQLIPEWDTAASITSFRCKLLHSCFYSHGSLFRFSRCLPESDIVHELVHMALESLLSFLNTPYPYSMLYKPFNYEWCLIIYSSDPVKHEYQ